MSKYNFLVEYLLQSTVKESIVGFFGTKLQGGSIAQRLTKHKLRLRGAETPAPPINYRELISDIQRWIGDKPGKTQDYIRSIIGRYGDEPERAATEIVVFVDPQEAGLQQTQAPVFTPRRSLQRFRRSLPGAFPAYM